MKNKLVLLLLIALLSSCSGEKKAIDALLFDFSYDMDSYKSLEESNYKLSFEILPLGLAADSSAAYDIQKVVMNDNYIYIIANKNLWVYDNQRNFINRIVQGRAGNEIMNPTNFAIDDQTGNIELIDNFSFIKVFNASGTYINSKRFDPLLTELGKIGNRSLHYRERIQDGDSYFTILDGDRTKPYVEKRGANEAVRGFSNAHVTKYDGDLYFIACFDNVVYKMGEKDKEPVKYAILNNTFSDATIKSRNAHELATMCENDKKFTSILAFRRLSDDLFYIDAFAGKNSRAFFYDKSINTAYKQALPTILYGGTAFGSYKNKTIHYFDPANFSRLDEAKFDSQTKELYAKMKERHDKYGPDQNPYLILVSYDNKK